MSSQQQMTLVPLSAPRITFGMKFLVVNADLLCVMRIGGQNILTRKYETHSKMQTSATKKPEILHRLLPNKLLKVTSWAGSRAESSGVHAHWEIVRFLRTLAGLI